MWLEIADDGSPARILTDEDAARFACAVYGAEGDKHRRDLEAFPVAYMWTRTTLLQFWPDDSSAAANVRELFPHLRERPGT